MNPRIERVCVLGAGVIGVSWAMLFVAAGLEVVVVDPDPAAEERFLAYAERTWPVLSRLGLAQGFAPKRVRAVRDPLEGLEGVDFVQESAPERLELKRALIGDVDAVAPPEVVIASSSSGFGPSALAATCRYPERVIVGHPFHPVHLVPVVEVVGGSAPEWVLDTATAFYERVGKRPVRVAVELPGHIVNRLQAALWREAYWLLSTGAATVGDIDTAISYGPGLRWALLGPFATQHLSGGDGGLARVLEHLGPPMVEWWADFETPRLDAELVARATIGVADELAGLDQSAMEAERDQLLEMLVAAKTRAQGLPGSHPRSLASKEPQ
ncbi:MAG TPA: 3-hydroxyacyl-CoA dehydrogenase NAD-binding domain-containing protein [Acidimicrobiales bacterium]|nr:3-hydroxyacyl-CoA dehydrogenase NAD-binding domain-containing protein [Acidimicrobiales bacterium]HUA95417.1 3-hydroxyacyl-CoA dehydrogenase NAD-binding domain-containing protein [Acidimicrobiales bacterium]